MEHGIFFWIIIGGVAGWLAGKLMEGGGFGLLMDILLGIVGAFVGAWLTNVLHISIGTGWLASLVTATAGAALLLLLSRLIKRVL